MNIDLKQNRKIIDDLNSRRERQARALKTDEWVMTFLISSTTFVVGFALCLILLVKGGCHV